MGSFNLVGWLKTWFRQRVKTIVKRRPHYRLQMEELETRLAPATLVWTGAGLAGNDHWSNPANWQGGVIPTVGAPVDLLFPNTASYFTSVDDVGSVASPVVIDQMTIGAGPYLVPAASGGLNGGYLITGNGTSAVVVGNPSTGTGLILVNTSAVATIEMPITFGSAVSTTEFINVQAAATLYLAPAVATTADLSATAATQLTMKGAGTLYVGGNNTGLNAPFKIDDTIGDGVVSMLTPNALGTGTITVSTSTQLQLDILDSALGVGGTINNNLVLNGAGPGGTTGALLNIAGNNTWAGNVLMNSTNGTDNTTIGVDALSGANGISGGTPVIINTTAASMDSPENFYPGQTFIPTTTDVFPGEDVRIAGADNGGGGAIFNPNVDGKWTIGAVTATSFTLKGSVGIFFIASGTWTVPETLTITGAISNANTSPYTLTKEGLGTLYLNPQTIAGNTYLGNTIVNNGILQIGQPFALGPGGGTTFVNTSLLESGTLALNYTGNTNIATQYLFYSQVQTITLAGVVGGTTQLTVGYNGQTTPITLSGVPNTDAMNIQNAFNAMPTISGVGASVTVTPQTPTATDGIFDVTFVGSLGGIQIPTLNAVVTSGLGTGSAVVGMNTPVSLTGTTANASLTVSGLVSTGSLFAGMSVTGAGIPSGTTIAAIVSPTQITLSQSATAGGSVPLTFSIGAPIGFQVPNENLVLNGFGVQGVNVPPRQPKTETNGLTPQSEKVGALENITGANAWEQPITLWSSVAQLAISNAFANYTEDAVTIGAQAPNPTPPATAYYQGFSNLTINGAITDNGIGIANQYSFSKVGLGRVILTSANTFTADVDVLEGALNIRDSNALGLGATLKKTVWFGASLELQADGIPDSSGLAGLYNLIIPADNHLDLNGIGWNGEGALYSLSGQNKVEGEVSLTTTLIAFGPTTSSPTSIGVAPDPDPTNIQGESFNDLSQLTIDGVIDNKVLPAAPAPETYLVKTGFGELVLTNANTYIANGGVAGSTGRPATLSEPGAVLTAATYLSPQTDIQQGWITIQNDNALGGTIATTDSLDPPVQVESGAALVLKQDLNGNDLYVTYNMVLSGTGLSFIDPLKSLFPWLNQKGALENLDGANTVAGYITLNSKVTDPGVVGIGVELDGANIPNPPASELTLTAIGTSGAAIQDGMIPGEIEKLGSQRLIIQDPGTYTGNVGTGVEIKQGVLQIQNDTALGTGTSLLPLATIVDTGAALEIAPTVPQLNGGILRGLQVYYDNLTLNGTGDTTFGDAPLTILSNDNVWRGNITLDTNLAVTFQNALGDAAVPVMIPNGAGIVGGGMVNVVATTPGSSGVDAVQALLLSGTIAAGSSFTLQVQDQAGQTATTGAIPIPINLTTGLVQIPVLVANIQTALNLLAPAFGGLAAAGIATVATGSPIIDVLPNSRFSVTGTVGDGAATANPADLTVAGGGELVLAGANTYGGTTYVDQGILTIENAQALGVGVTSEVQTVTVGAGVTGFTLSLDGAVTPTIPYTGGPNDLTTIQNDLNALATIGGPGAGGSVTVTQAGSVFTVTFGGALAGFRLDPLVAGNVAPSTANVTVATQTYGSGGTVVANGAQLQMQGGITVSNEPLRIQGPGTPGEPDVQNVATGTAVASGLITSTSPAGTPIVITTPSTANLTDGETVTIFGVNGNTAANNDPVLNPAWVVTVLSSTTFSLQNVSGAVPVSSGAFISGGTWTADTQVGAFSLAFTNPNTGLTQTTTGLPAGASANQVQAALNQLLSIQQGSGTGTAAAPTGSVLVDESASDVYTVLFEGSFALPAATNLPLIVANNTAEQIVSLTGTSGSLTLGFTGYAGTTVAIPPTVQASGGVGAAGSLENALNNLLMLPTSPGGGAGTASVLATPTGNSFIVTFGGSLAGLGAFFGGSVPGDGVPLLVVGNQLGNADATVAAANGATATVTTVIQGGSANVTPTQWFSVGPAPINDGEVSGTGTAADVTGAVTGVVADVNDPNILYIATAGGGAWKTVDATDNATSPDSTETTWTPLFDGVSAVQQFQVIGKSGSFTLSFSNPNSPSIITGNITSGNLTVTSVSSTVGLAVGMLVTGSNIPSGATIASISGTTLTLSAPGGGTDTATATSVVLTFGTPMLPYNATADQVQAALNGLASIGGADASVQVSEVPTPGVNEVQQLDLTKGPVVTGTATVGLATVTGMATTAGLSMGMLVSGPGIPVGTQIAAPPSATSITLTENATVGAGTNPLTFGATPGSTQFTLSYGGFTSPTPLLFVNNATDALNIAAQLNSSTFATIGGVGGVVTVTQTGLGVFSISFGGTLAQEPLTPNMLTATSNDVSTPITAQLTAGVLPVNTYTVSFSGGSLANQTLTEPGSAVGTLAVLTYASAGTAAVGSAVVAGGVDSVTLSAGGAGYTNPTVTFAAPSVANGVQATGAVLSDGVVSSIIVTNFGFGYGAAPAVTITPAPGDSGAGATAVAVLSTGISGLPAGDFPLADVGPISWSETPVVTFPAPGPGGTLAQGYAIWDPTTGFVNNIIMTNPGAGYPAGPLLVTVTDPSDGFSETYFLTTTEVVQKIKITNPGAGYTLDPIVTIAPSGAAGASTATAVAFRTGSITGVIILNPGSGYTSAPSMIFGGGGLGAFGTANLGATTVQDGLGTSAVEFSGAIAQDPAPGASGTLYLGTGDGENLPDSYYGTGVYITHDYGQTWNLLVDKNNFNPLAGQTINQIVPEVDPATGDTYVFVASSDRGVDTADELVDGETVGAAIWRFDTNADLWTDMTSDQFNPAPPLGADAAAIDNIGIAASTFTTDASWSSVTLSGGKLFAALGTDAGFPFAGNSENFVYVCTNPFAAPVPGGNGLFAFNWATQNNNAYQLEQDGAGFPAYPAHQLGFLDSANGLIRVASGGGNVYAAVFDPSVAFPSGYIMQYVPPGVTNPSDPNSWSGDSALIGPPAFPQPTPFPALPYYLSNQGNTISAMVVDAAGDIYIGGTDSGTGLDYVLELPVGGAAWMDISQDTSVNSPHTGINAMTIDSQQRLVVATNGGVWRYDPTTLTWLDLNGNLAISQVVGVATDPTNPNNILESATNVGVAQFSGALNWTNVNSSTTGPGGVFFDPNNSRVAYDYVNGSLNVSTNGGATWKATGIVGPNPLYNGTAFTVSNLNVTANTTELVFWTGAVLERIDYNYVTSVVTQNSNLDVAKATAIVGPVTSLAISTNQGPFLADTLNFPDVTDLGTNNPDPDTVYVTDGTHIAVTKDNGLNWTTASRTPPQLTAFLAANPGVKLSITDLVVDPTDRDHVFAVIGGQSANGVLIGGGFVGTPGVDRVFESYDAGVTWTDISAGLPDSPAYSLVLDARSGNLYLGNDEGVYELAGGVVTATNSWQRFGTGLPNVSVHYLNLNESLNILTAGTYGRSVYQFFLDFATTNTGAVRAASGSDVWNGPIILTGAATISAQGNPNLQNGISVAQLQILGGISDLTANALTNTLTKIGEGDVFLGGTSIYNGVTVVQQGNLVIDNSSGLGSPGVAGEQLLFVDNAVAGETTFNLTFDGLTTPSPLTYTGIGATDAADIKAALSLLVPLGVPGGIITSVVADPTDSIFTIQFGGAMAAATGPQVEPVVAAPILSPGEAATPTTAFGASDSGTVVDSGSILQLETPGAASQTLTLSGFATGDKFALQYSNGVQTGTTGPITYTGGISPGTDTNIAAALTALLAGFPALAGSGVFVNPLSNNVFTIAFSGLAALNLTQVKPVSIVSAHGAIAVSSTNAEPLFLYGNGVNRNGHYSGALENVSNNNTYNGIITLATAGQGTATPVTTIGVDAGSSLTLTSPGYITDLGGAAGTGSLAKEGTGLLTLTAADIYQGNTYVDQGDLNIQNNQALGAGYATTTVLDGAQLQLQTAPGGAPLNVTAENLDLSGTGDPANGGGALLNVDGNNTWGAAVGLLLAGSTTSSSINVTGLASTAKLSVGDPVSGVGIPAGDTIAAILGATAIHLSAAATATGTPTLSFGTIITLDSVEQFSPQTTPTSVVPINVADASGPVNNAIGITGIASPVVITTPSTTNLTTGEQVTVVGVTGNTAANGTWFITVFGSTTFELNGSASNGAYISGGSWTTASGTTLTLASPVVEPQPAFQGGSFATPLTMSSGLSKVGAGTLILTQADTYTGTTYVNGGNLYVQNSNSLGLYPGYAVQRVTTFDQGVSVVPADTFALSFNGSAYTTIQEPIGVSAATLQSALAGLASIGTGNVHVSENVIYSGISEVETLTFNGAIAGTTQYNLSFNGSGVSSTFTYGGPGAPTPDATTILTALESLTTIGSAPGAVTVTADSTDTIFTITFGATLQDQHQPLIVANTFGGGAALVAEATAGTGFPSYIYTVAFTSPMLTLTGATAILSNTVTGLSSTSLLSVGMPVSGPGIPAGTTIASIAGLNSITLSSAATASGTVSLSFAETGPQPLLVATPSRPLLTASVSTAADGRFGAVVAAGASLQLDGDPQHTGATLSVSANTTLALNGSGVNVDLTGMTNLGSTTISGLDTTAALVVGMLASGANIPVGATIASILGPTSITLTQPAAATGTTALSFSGGALVSVSGNDTWGGAVVLESNATVGTAPGTTLTIAGQIQDPIPAPVAPASLVPPNLTKIGTGTLQFPTGISLTGNTTSGTTTINGLVSVALAGITTSGSTTISGLGTTAALAVGESVSGADIPVGATIASILGPNSITLTQPATASGPIPLNFTPPLSVGMLVTGANIQAGTTITAILSATSVVLSLPATATAGGMTLTFSSHNTYTGNTFIDAGILNIQTSASLGINTSATQALTLSGTNGTFKLFFSGYPAGTLPPNSVSTGALPYNVTAAALQIALNNMLATVGSPGYVSAANHGTAAVATEASGNTFVITFSGTLTAVDVPLLSAPSAFSTGNTVATTAILLLGDASRTVVQSGASLQIQASIPANATGKPLIINGNGFNNAGALESVSGSNSWAAANIILGSNSSIGAASGSNLAIAVPITDNYQVQTITFNGFAPGNTYTLSFDGQTTGTLTYSASTATNAGALTAALAGLPSIALLGGTATVTFVAGTTYQVAFNGNMAGLSWPQVTGLSGVGSFTLGAPTMLSNGYGVNKYGAGIVQFSSSTGNAYTGLTNVFAGELQLDDTGSGFAILNNLQVGDGIQLNLGTFNLNDSFTLSYNGATSPAITYLTNPTLEASSIQGALNNLATIGGVLPPNSVTVVPDPITPNAYDITFGGGLAGAALPFSPITAADITTSTNVNSTLVSNGAAFSPDSVIVQTEGNNQMAPGSTVTVNGDGKFDLNNFSQSVNSLTITDGTVTTGAGASGGMLTVANLVSMTGGTVDLPAANSQLLLGASGSVTAVSDAAGAAQIAGKGSLSLGGTTRTFTINAGPQPSDLDISAVIAGTAGEGLIKAGAGRLELNAVETYTGPTTINTGDVQVDSLAAIQNVVLNGGSVSGQGSVATIAGPAAAAAVGKIDPGINGTTPVVPGVLNTGTITAGQFTTINVDLNHTNAGAPQPGTDYDQINATGNINLGGLGATPGALLTGTSSLNVQAGETFTILQATGSVTGFLSRLVGAVQTPIPNNGVIFLSGQKFLLQYTPNSVVLTRELSTATVAITAAPSATSVYGQDVIFSATVTPEAGASLPASGGLVTFTLDANTINAFTETANVVAGVATFDPQGATGNNFTWALGTHTVDATFTDTNVPTSFAPAHAATLVQTVNQGPTSVAVLSASPSATPTYGQTVTITAGVTPNIAPTTTGSFQPTGTVTFSVDGGAGQTVNLSATQASIALPSTLTVGVHHVHVVYNGDANYLGSAIASDFAVTVVPDHANVVVTSAPASSALLGQPVTFTATVNAALAGSQGLPTGTVNFYDGAPVAANLLNASPIALIGQSASLIDANLSVNMHTITVIYSGDVNYLTSTGTLSFTVGLTTSSTALIAAPTTSTFGQSVTLAATVTPNILGVGTPTGTVAFFDTTTGTSLGTVTLNAAGVALVTTSALTTANHVITATYSGDSNFSTSTGTIGNFVVSPATTSTALSASPNSGDVLGQAVTLTASVAATSPGSPGTPTGTVTFTDVTTNTPLGTAPLNAFGIAVLPTSVLTINTHMIVASYNGAVNYGPSNGDVNNYVVAGDTSTVTITAAPASSVFGQTVAFTADVVGAPPGSGLPLDGGTVVFYDGPVGSTAIGTATLTSGQATLNYSGLTVAMHNISAAFLGDANLAGSNGVLTNFVVAPANTTVTVSAAPAGSVNFGSTATFTASVSATLPGLGTPADGDLVTFKDGAATLGTASLSGGVAIFATSSLSAGVHVISATFDGDANFGVGTGVLAPNYNVGVAGTSTAVSVSPTSGDVFGQAVSLTAVVSNTSGGTPGIPGGSVSFWDGPVGTGVFLGTRTLSGGQATLLTTALSVNSSPGHTINASYSGSASFGSSVGTLTNYLVAQDGTTTSVATLQTSPVLGQPVQFTATVTANVPGSGTPSNGDLVTFKDNGVTIGTGALIGGVATFTYSGLTLGTHTITAFFAGDLSFLSSTGTLANFTVAPSATTTTVSAAPASPTVFGQLVTISATVSASSPSTGTPANGDIVTFYDGAAVPANLIGTAGLVSGIASVNTSSLIVGLQTLTAVFSGDANFTTSTGLLANYDVTQAITQTSLAPLSNIVYGQPAVFTATVTATSGVGVPTSGTITFFDGGVSVGTATLSGSNTATFTTTAPLTLGNQSITAVYNGGGNFLASPASNAQVQAVGQAGTSIALTESAPAVGLGQPVTFTATVTPLAPSTAAITSGTVLFKDGAVTIGTVTLSGSNVATLPISTLASGVHQISASYVSTANYTGSTSSLLTESILNVATITPTPTPAAPLFGQATTLTVGITGSGAAPTGTVTVLDNTTSTTLASNVAFASAIDIGDGTVLHPFLAAGIHSLTIQYSGDANYAPGAKTISLTVGADVTATTLTASAPTPAVYGEPLTFTAVVGVTSPAGGAVPTSGVVTFKDGGATLGTVTLSGSNVATYSTAILGVATHAITASYGGSADDASSTGTLASYVVKAAATTTVVSGAPSPSSFGQAVTFSATVTASGPSAATVTSGIVTFKDGATTLGTGAVTNGVATFTTSTLTAATHSITAAYAATTDFAASTSPVFSHVVSQAGTTTSLTSSLPAGSAFGQAVTFKATVTNSAGGTNPTTGSVVFKDGAATLGTVALSNSNVATFNLATLGVATSPHSITASFVGTTTYAGSTSNTVVQTVSQASTTVALSSTPVNWALGQAVTFTANVTSPSGGVPTGAASGVIFTITGPNGTVTPAATSFTNGKATLSYTFPNTAGSAGAYSVSVTYAGNANFAGSAAGPVTQADVRKASTITLATSNASPGHGAAITFTATVAGLAGPPTGTVSFFDGSTFLGTGVVVNGKAKLTLSTLAIGTHKITATYGGDQNFNPAALANALTQNVTNKAIGRLV